MQKQFLCLANARHKGGRILIVSPIEDTNVSTSETRPIFTMIAKGSKNNIPTGFVADVLPLDIIQVKLSAPAQKGATLTIDPWSLQLPARISSTHFRKNIAPTLESKNHASPNPILGQENSIQLLNVQSCQISEPRQGKQAPTPMLAYGLNGVAMRSPTCDALLLDSYHADECIGQFPKDAFIVLQQRIVGQEESPIVLGVIQ